MDMDMDMDIEPCCSRLLRLGQGFFLAHQSGLIVAPLMALVFLQLRPDVSAPRREGLGDDAPIRMLSCKPQSR